MKVFVVFGTRPEAIKMCPLVLELKKHTNIECVVCLTGQHREMLKQVMDAFHIEADINLDIMKDRQTLTTITTSILEKMEPILREQKPDVVLVHGDTTTSYAAALAAFYQQIPVGHVEAGLRTGDIYSPYPEEMNRLMTDRLSTYYFAPTIKNQQNLSDENVKNNVYVTGNTVIDAFKYTVSEDYTFSNKVMGDIFNKTDRKTVLITAHRRENLGTPLRNICNAIAELAKQNNEIDFIYPVHLNPAVREVAFEILEGIDNVYLTDPVDVLDMHNALSRCFFVMTDSGGLQEEAPSFGKPVLVLRTETERPEAVEAGTVLVVGNEQADIVKAATELINNEESYNKMSRAINPYGDGKASERIAQVLLEKGQ